MTAQNNILGFDYGLARTGVAVADVEACIAHPLTVLKCKAGRPDWAQLELLVQTWQPQCFVVGRPEATSPPQLLHGLKTFIAGLRRRTGLPVHETDESFTSSEAQALLKEQRRANLRARLAKGGIDKSAAALILESWLDNRGKDDGHKT